MCVAVSVLCVSLAESRCCECDAERDVCDTCESHRVSLSQQSVFVKIVNIYARPMEEW